LTYDRLLPFPGVDDMGSSSETKTSSFFASVHAERMLKAAFVKLSSSFGSLVYPMPLFYDLSFCSSFSLWTLPWDHIYRL